jgi:FixJ family two-component response regulator
MSKILIIDNDLDVQLYLSGILITEGHDLFASGDGRKALNIVKRHSPDLILLEMNLPGMNGMGVLEEIKKLDRSMTVIMLTGYGDIKSAVKAMKTGAFDFVTKPFDDKEILATIRNALRAAPKSRDKFHSPLSRRESEVLNWLKTGKTSWDISVILGISERTVNFHVRNIIQKLNAVSRIHAVAVAAEKGIN